MCKVCTKYDVPGGLRSHLTSDVWVRLRDEGGPAKFLRYIDRHPEWQAKITPKELEAIYREAYIENETQIAKTGRPIFKPISMTITSLQADPELERLLREEEAIEQRVQKVASGVKGRPRDIYNVLDGMHARGEHFSDPKTLANFIRDWYPAFKSVDEVWLVTRITSWLTSTLGRSYI